MNEEIPAKKEEEESSKSVRWGKDEDKLSFQLLRKQLKQYGLSLKEFFTKVSQVSLHEISFLI